LLFSCNQMKERETGGQSNVQMDHEMGADELHLNDQQVQLGNITVDSIMEHTLGEEFLITGIVNINQNQASSIASRVMGRIEKLHLKNIGDVIEKGELLYEIYSEDLDMAIRELLLANEKIKTLKNEQVNMTKILESTRNKLKLYGLSDDQIKEFETKGITSNTIKIFSTSSGVITSVDVKEGNYIMEGASVFHLADLSSLWVEGQVYSDYLNFVKSGMTARVTFPGLPNKEFNGKIIFINPELNTASKINRIRIEITNKSQELKPGIQAYISVLTNQINALAAPTDAIIRDGKGSTVWVKTGKNMFKSRMVTTGAEANSYTEIKSGLKKGDIIVVTGAYLLNSEFIFKNGVNPMEGHDMSKM
jgi:membrane fusion protein, copper/silver efflux system